MPRNNNIHNYILAFSILKGIERINTIENLEDEESDELILPSSELGAEGKLLKEEAFNRLSQEAKNLIITVINAPDEFINLFTTPKRALFSKSMFKECLIKSWKSPILVETILGEIGEWVKMNLE